MNLHLTYRHLAIALSEAGFPTLRLDYPGTCDSSGSSRDSGRFPAILSALNQGADYLKMISGVSQLALFGARFGANLAIELAATRKDVSQLALWGVYQSGRQFLRTESAFDRLITANPGGLRPTHWQNDDTESAGFLYRADLVEDIAQTSVDRKSLTARTLLFDWDDEGDGSKAGNSLAEVTTDVNFAGLIDRGSLSLQKQAVPNQLIEQVVGWLTGNSEPMAIEPGTDLSELNPLLNEISLNREMDRAISERAVQFGVNDDLFGILTLPDPQTHSPPHTAILLINGGNNHRPGINRNYTEWARRWAAAGYAVLRMDIRGLGDSPPLIAADLNRLYLERTVKDVEEAAAWLRSSTDADRLVLCGYCAGAYQALNLARRGADIDALMLIELLRYYPWEPLQNADNPWKARVLRYWARYHPMWLVHRGRIGRWLNALCGKGVETLVVYRQDEEMLSRFSAETEPLADMLAGSGHFQLKTLSPSNHIISPLFAQEELSDVLMAFLDDIADRKISPS